MIMLDPSSIQTDLVLIEPHLNPGDEISRAWHAWDRGKDMRKRHARRPVTGCIRSRYGGARARDRIGLNFSKAADPCPDTILSAVAAAALLLAASPLAHAATVGKTVDGKALSVDVNCVDRVEIQPQADLNGKIMMEATSSDASDLDRFRLHRGRDCLGDPAAS